MKPIFKKLLLLYSLFLFQTALSLPGQGWIKAIDDPNVTLTPFHILQTQDGGYFLSGTKHTTGPSIFFLARVDVHGDTLWTRNLFPNSPVTSYNAIQTQDGGFVFTGLHQTVPIDSLVLAKLSATGELLWKTVWKQSTLYERTRAVAQTTDKGFITIGKGGSPQGVGQLMLTKFDSTGLQIWHKNYGVDSLDISNGYHVFATPDGGAVGMGNRKIGGIDIAFLVRVDSLGDTLWTRTYPDSTFHQSGYQATGTSQNNFVFATSSASGLSLLKIDLAGNIVWNKLDTLQLMNVMDITPDNKDGVILSGNSIHIPPNYGLFVHLDAAGNTRLTNALRGPYSGSGYCATSTSDGGMVACGIRYHPNFVQINEIFIAKLDSLGNTGAAWIRGKVFEEANSNCIQDAGEDNLENILVLANPGPHYALTDAQGNYEMNLDTGTYQVFAIPRSNYWEPVCPAPGGLQSVTVAQVGDTAHNTNFGHNIAIYCPLMEVNVSTGILRPCSSNVYTLSYCNQGTFTADSAYIEVEIDSFLTLTSASQSWDLPQTGNLFVFQLGNIAPGQCGTISLTTLLSCSAERLRTHCVTAHIYPDSLCDPIDPNWDQSSVAVTAQCRQDSVEFKLRNLGQGNMSLPGSYVILEDNIMRSQSTFQLIAGDSLAVIVPGNGSTWALLADQVPGHPGESLPRAFTEACGRDSAGEFSTGFITQLSMDDINPFIDIDCQQNRGSYDPNDKQVFPNGTGPDHAIFQQHRLEYHIRFQNTGNDTAFKVVIRDTISADLDLTTYRHASSSHPFTFRIYGPGIMEWTFDGILLPDSNVNEPKSHGYVRFSIDQVPNLPLGTRIENRVGIYFDYNLPVLTNTAFVTLSEPWGQVSIDELEAAQPALTVFPNPLKETATFAIEGTEYAVLSLQIFDLTGQLKKEQTDTHTSKITLQRGNLSAGMYLFRVTDGISVLGSGRLVIYE